MRLLELESGGELSLANNQGGFYANALQAASAEGFPEVVRLLFDKDARG